MSSARLLTRGLAVCACLISAWTGAALGQEDPLLEDWRWVHYGIESGLPSESVIHLAESEETLWVATSDGIAWFDGYRWNAVAVAGLDPQVITDMAPDHRGGVYLAAGGALYKVSRLGSEAIPLTLEGVPIDAHRVAATGVEEIYFTQGPDVFRLDGDRVERLPALPSRPRGGGDSNVMVQGVDGVLWARASGPFEPLLELVDSAWIPRMTPLRGGDVLAFAGSEHSVLLANWGPAGTYVWLRTGTGEETRHVGAAGHVLTAATISNQGDVVLAYGSGLLVVRRAGQWRVLQRPPTDIFGVRSVLFVHNGNLWLVADGGLYLHRAAQRWRGDPEIESLEPIVNVILPATNGDLWVGGGTALLVRRSDGTIQRFPSLLGTPLAPVTALAEDREGGIWVGSGGGFDGSFRWFGGRWQHYGPEQGLGARRIHQIAVDREGRLWFLGLSARLDDAETGAWVFDGNGFERWSTAEGLLNDRVYDFSDGPDGSRWIATAGGLSRWREGGWTHWTLEDGLRRNGVFTLALDPSGRLWFGHGAGDVRGLGFVDLDDRIGYVASNDALAQRYVWDLAIGADGALWVSTKSGLGVFRNGEGTILDRRHGLKNALLWPVVPVRGRVLVGTTGGGVVELETSERASPPPVVFATAPLVDQNRVILRWHAFAYHGQQLSEDIPTRYRIDEEDWSSWSTAREIGPVALGDGRHSFEVQAKGLFGAVGQVGKVAFRIAPPFYRHPLFLAGGAVWLLVMLAWAAAYWRRERQTLALISQSEAYFRSLIENASDLISVVDQSGLIQYQSPSSLAVLGYTPDERQGRSMFELIHAEDHSAARELVRSASLNPGETRIQTVRVRHKDGTWRTLEATGAAHVGTDGKPVGVIHARDVTERVEAERERELLNAQLQQAQKMEAVGQLTGGIAHDFNNLLTVISGNLELAREDMKADGVRNLTDQALDAAHRAGALTQRLLAFSRKQPLSPRAVDLNELLDGIGALLRRTLGATIAIRIVRKHGLWKCEVDPGQMENAILNLAINSRDAMPGNGHLTIESENVWLTADSVPHFPDLTPGPYVRCTVQDDGTGMPPDVLARVFEPFFTTKDIGRGSGLGMSMVYGFVKQTGGDLMIESAVGEGTSVSLFLPRAGADAEELDEPAGAQPEPQGVGETVLVVEDDESVRRLTVGMLDRLGYTTLEAEDGPSALRVLESAGEIDLLFTDMVLPGGMSGADIAARASEARPDLRVLYVSGNTKDEIVHRGRIGPGVRLLNKPFTKSDLAHHVRDVIDDRARR